MSSALGAISAGHLTKSCQRHFPIKSRVCCSVLLARESVFISFLCEQEEQWPPVTFRRVRVILRDLCWLCAIYMTLAAPNEHLVAVSLLFTLAPAKYVVSLSFAGSPSPKHPGEHLHSRISTKSTLCLSTEPPSDVASPNK